MIIRKETDFCDYAEILKASTQKRQIFMYRTSIFLYSHKIEKQKRMERKFLFTNKFFSIK